jgi:glycosyltransferase involved in cell wall biosynthesis
MLAAPSILAVATGKVTRTKTIVKIACSGPYGDLATARQSFFGRWKLKMVLRNADRLICLTHEMERELLSAGVEKEKIVRIPNGVNTDRFRPAENDKEKGQLRASLGLVPHDFHILFMGRLTSQKRPDLALNAFRQAFAHKPNVKLVILGDGPLRAELLNSVQSYGLQSQVLIPGNQLETERYYRASDLFVLPSEAEGMSNSLLEAMATGLACIASRNRATEEILRDGENGILVPLGNVEALAQAMILLANDTERATKLGQTARQLMVSTYHMAIVSQQYETMYAQLLRKEQSV